MRKKFGLFVVGFVLALTAFWLYQYVTGAGMMPSKKGSPRDIVISAGHGEQMFEFRDKTTGELKAIVQAKSAEPVYVKGELQQGQYLASEPMATLYLKDGRTMQLRGDKCLLVLDQLPKGSKPAGVPSGVDLPPVQLRMGRMMGNVLLTISAKTEAEGTSAAGAPPPATGFSKIANGRMTIAFDGEVEVMENQNLLTSPGKVHVRSDGVDFDGEGLNLSFNKDEQKVEYLRIDKGDTAILRGVGKQAFSLDSAEGGAKKEATKPGAGPAAGGSATQVAVNPGTHPATTGKAPGAVATTKPSFGATPYRVSFQNVTASVGTSKLTSATLYALFTFGGAGPEKPEKPAAADAAAPVAVPPAAPQAPAKTPELKTPAIAQAPAATAPADPRAPYAPAGPEDLVIHWVGPLEMRPAGPQDVHLVNAKDSALEAVGTKDQPVTLVDGGRTVTSGRLWYHTAEDRVEIEPGDLPSVHLADPVQGDVVCRGVSFIRTPQAVNQMVTLLGPGTIDVPQSVLKREGGKPEKGAAEVAVKSDAPPLRASWKTRANVYFVMEPDAKNPSKKTAAIRRAILTGDVAIKDPTFEMFADDSLDLKIVPTGDPKTPQSLESMVALGKVRIKYARPNSGLDDASKPDGMTADRLELFTSPRPDSKVLLVSRVLATGNVVAWSYSDRKEMEGDAAADKAGAAKVDPAKAGLAKVDPARTAPVQLVKQTIHTPKLDVAVEPKDKPPGTTATPADAVSGMAGMGIKSLVASDGVEVELEGMGGADGQTVVATAQTLTAEFPRDDPRSGKATLEAGLGVNQQDGVHKSVLIEQGDNRIIGERVVLDQKSHAIEIPGPGVFTFREPGKNGEPDSRVQITWTKNMSYDNKAQRARFTGLVQSKLLDKPDQISELTCKDSLEVVLAQKATGDNEATSRLSSMVAKGDVLVKGATYEPGTKNVLTSVLMKSSETDYDAITKTLHIPGQGSVAVEDYRVDAEKPAGKDSGGKAPEKAPDAKGITAFSFEDGLTYVGDNGKSDAGQFRMSKNVIMHHIAMRPFNMPGADGKTKPVKDMWLHGQTLTAQMAQTKETGGGKSVSSPLGLGSGGNMSISHATADGDARLTLGDTEVSGVTLDFDVLKKVAVARGGKGMDAQVSRPDQGLMSTPDDITWEMGTNKFNIPNPRGSFQLK